MEIQAMPEFYDNRRPAHPMELTPGVRWLIVRSQVEVRESQSSEHGSGGHSTVVIKHFVERAVR